MIHYPPSKGRCGTKVLINKLIATSVEQDVILTWLCQHEGRGQPESEPGRCSLFQFPQWFF